MPNTIMRPSFAFRSAFVRTRKSAIFRSSRLKIWMIFMPDRFSLRKVFRSVVALLTARWARRENRRNKMVKITMKGTKHSTISVRA